MFLNFEGLGSKTSVFMQQNDVVGGIYSHLKAMNNEWKCPKYIIEKL